MSKSNPTVYISSSFEDLQLHRRSAREQLAKLGCNVVSMETYTAEERPPLERCLRDVRSADIYIGIFAWRYGTIAPDKQQSFPELEYREAGHHNIERLIFLLHPNTPWPPNQMDSRTPAGDTAINRLREELELTHLCSYFSTPESLANEISVAVGKFLDTRTATAAEPVPEQTPAELAIQDHAQAVLEELAGFEPYYVSLNATANAVETPLPTRFERGLLPPSFEVVDRRLLGTAPRAELLEAAESAVDRFSQFVVLGEPGAGKTTLLRYLEYRASTRLASDPSAPVPLYIRLTQWPAGILDFGSLIVHERTVRALQAVPTRKLLLLLDELNEIDATSYRKKFEAIAHWIFANPSVPVVVATRRTHYESSRKLPLPSIMLHPLDNDRVQTFIRNYLGEQANALLAELIWETKGRVARRRLSHLARNPYLLRLLCYVYERTGKAPPPSRGQIFEILVEALWARENNKDSTHEYPYHSFVRACSELAIAITSQGKSTSVHRDFALKHLAASAAPERMLEFMRNTSVIQTAKNDCFVQFTHQMLMDYFGAEYLRVDPARIRTVISRPVLVNSVRLSRPVDEAVLMLLDLLPSDKVLEPLIGQDPFLAAQLAGAVGIGHHVLRDLIDALTDALNSTTQREVAVSSLAQLGTTGVRALRSLLMHEHKWVRRSAVQSLARVGSADAIEAVVQALGDSDRWVRREAAAAIGASDGPPRRHLEMYVATAFGELPRNERDIIGRELLGALSDQDVELRRAVVNVCGFSEEETTPFESSALGNVLEDSDPTWRIQRFLARCSEALDSNFSASFAHYLLIDILRTPDLPDDIKESLLEVSMRWLRTNWLHKFFSPTLDIFLKRLTPEPYARAELLLLLVRKLRIVRPGVNDGRRNRMLLRLLGEPRSVPRKAVAAVTDVVLDTMRASGQVIVSGTVLRRLVQDLPPGSPKRMQLEKMIRPATGYSPPNAPSQHPHSLSKISLREKTLLMECTTTAHALLRKEEIARWELEPLISCAEDLALAGHLYRCRYLIAHMMILAARCTPESLMERVIELGRRAVHSGELSEHERTHFAFACYRVADRHSSKSSVTAESLLERIGLERPHH